MFIKSLVAGLGAFFIFLVGLWYSGNAQASILNTFKPKSTAIGKSGAIWTHDVKSGAYLNGAPPNILLVSQRRSNFRQNNTKNYRRQTYRTNQRMNRGLKGSSFSGQINRSSSTRKRVSTPRSFQGKNKNSFRNNRYIFKRPKSRK